MICPECHGEGCHTYDDTDSRGEHTTEEEICEECEGTGKVESDLGDSAGVSW